MRLWIVLAVLGYFFASVASYFYFQRGLAGLIAVGLLAIVFGVCIFWHRALTGIIKTRSMVVRFSVLQAILIFALVTLVLILAAVTFIYRMPEASLTSVYVGSSISVATIFLSYSALSLICFSIGHAILSYVRTGTVSNAQQAAAAFGVGIAATILFFYLAALLGVLNRSALIAYCFIGFVAAVQHRKILYSAFVARTHALTLAFPFTTAGVHATLFGAALSIIVWMIAVGLGGYHPLNADDIRTYYTIPQTFVQQGGITTFAFDTLNQSTSAFAYFYAPLLLISPMLLQFSSMYFFILCLLALWALARRYFDSKTALMAIVFFSAIPWNMWFLYTAKVDFLIVFLTLCALLFLFRYVDEKSIRFVLLGGFILGVAVAIKYSVLLLLPAIGLAFFWPRSTQSLTVMARVGAIFVLSVCIGYAPWGIRSAALWGNPLHPFSVRGDMAGQTFATAEAKNFYKILYADAHEMNGMKPWWQNAWYLAGSVSQYSGNQIGPFFFGLLPLLILVRPKKEDRAILARLAVMVFLTAILWFAVSVSQIWYGMPLFALWSVLLGYYFFQVPRPVRYAICVAVLLVVTFRLDFSRTFMVRFYSRVPSAEQYLMPFGASALSLAAYANTELFPSQPNAVAFPMGQQRSILFNESFRHIYGDNVFLMAWSAIAADTSSAAEARERLRALSITHIFYIPEDVAFDRAVWCERPASIGCRSIDIVLQRFDALAQELAIVKQTDAWTVYAL